jgi:hypothetical protein
MQEEKSTYECVKSKYEYDCRAKKKEKKNSKLKGKY